LNALVLIGSLVIAPIVTAHGINRIHRLPIEGLIAFGRARAKPLVKLWQLGKLIVESSFKLELL